MAVCLLIAFSSTYCCGIKAGKRVCWYGAGWCILNAHTEKKNAGNPKRASCLTLISSLKPKSIYIAITPTAVLHNTSLFSLCNQIHNQSCPNQHLTKIGETKTGEEVSRGKKSKLRKNCKLGKMLMPPSHHRWRGLRGHERRPKQEMSEKEKERRQGNFQNDYRNDCCSRK